jgi:peptide deformylase
MTPTEFLQKPPTLVYHPDPILRLDCQPIENLDEWIPIAPVMLKAMKDWRGCGLAAPQVGLSYQIFVLGVTKPMVFINPEILEVGERLALEIEGCLSIPGTVVKVSRPRKIKVNWVELSGEKKTAQFEGLTARAWLHEFDHLNSKLIIDYQKRDNYQ